MMEETPLARIPFGSEAEEKIASMARWMRFIGSITVVFGLLFIFVALLALTVGGFVFAGARADLGKVGGFIHDQPAIYFAASTFALIVALLNTYAAYLLTLAADDFHRVARTDIEDQLATASGLRKLKTYFKIHVGIAVSMLLFLGVLVYAIMAIRGAAPTA